VTELPPLSSLEDLERALERGARQFRVIGPGRAGLSMAGALANVGWQVAGVLGRDDDLAGAADDVDLLLIATPDGSIAEVAAEVEPVEATVVAHMAGSLGLDVLGRHARRAGLHPLVALADPDIGAVRLRRGVWFAVAGDPLVQDVVADLNGRWFALADADRAAYHAAAVVASNHLVALMGQVERIAAGIGVPAEAYLDLARASLENVAHLGAAAALTGPVSRGDWDTVARHLEALDEAERGLYRALAESAARLAARPLPERWPES
jgi:predicted short-subunit dehydrogenase-like oxidoreductase (DUF2520 family)